MFVCEYSLFGVLIDLLMINYVYLFVTMQSSNIKTTSHVLSLSHTHTHTHTLHTGY